MTRTFSIRELSRGGKILLDYDYIDIEDRKTHTYKGVFVPEKYAEEVKKYLEQKVLRDKNRKKASLLKYAGIAFGEIGEKTIQELKAEKTERSR